MDVNHKHFWQVIEGGAALSQRRRKFLEERVHDFLDSFYRLEARWCYFVEGQLEEQQLQKLQQLLSYHDKLEKWPEYALQGWLVMPRAATRSSWSSRAEEIARSVRLPLRRFERGICYSFSQDGGQSLHLSSEHLAAISDLFVDKMQETLLPFSLWQQHWQQQSQQQSLQCFTTQEFDVANESLALGLTAAELDYLKQKFKEWGRAATDVELRMFAEANSEHCRHKIFNAAWRNRAGQLTDTLFQLIKATTADHAVLSAYHDNAAVLLDRTDELFVPQKHGCYKKIQRQTAALLKCETHNHPCGVSPYPGAATGVGGEIRDEGATGRGGQPLFGMVGFAVSLLRLPGFVQEWEIEQPLMPQRSTPLQIMLEAPLGAATYANEFGRAQLAGFFRTFLQWAWRPLTRARDEDELTSTALYGYHKPLMLAGGVGQILKSQVDKKKLQAQDLLICLGGAAMRIGLGGGSASSQQANSINAKLDFSSVQRDDAEMERRCQEVIDRCWQLEQDNPILSIHDLGAGGLANAVPEMLQTSAVGGKLDLAKIKSNEEKMSALELWCNESQERYLIALKKGDLERFSAICQRECCPFSVLGEVTEEAELIVFDSREEQGELKQKEAEKPLDVKLDLLFGSLPLPVCLLQRHQQPPIRDWLLDKTLEEALFRVLKLPAVASKSFLITIGDRSVGGLTARDQFVGAWQTPVADVALSATSFFCYHGQALAIGERPLLALFNAKASVRIAIGEAVSNLAAVQIVSQKVGPASLGSTQEHALKGVALSANWMSAASSSAELERLRQGVEALSYFCRQLGLCVPVGKDSLSMRSSWKGIRDQQQEVISPLSVVISALASVADLRRQKTPELQNVKESVLLLVDLGYGKNRCAASALAQVYSCLDGEVPDIEADQLASFFNFIQRLHAEDCLLAYHDRSDGGLIVTLLEMIFASRLGLKIELNELCDNDFEDNKNLLRALFNEELGAVIQVPVARLAYSRRLAEEFELRLVALGEVQGYESGLEIGGYEADGSYLSLGKFGFEDTLACWSETSFRLQTLRDEQNCAKEERENLLKGRYRLACQPSFNISQSDTPLLKIEQAPRVAVLREQGTNGQREMAAAFYKAGFNCVDVNMDDLRQARHCLEDFQVLIACGGFSFGDVLGAGSGWAAAILQFQPLREQFARFFARKDRLSLGICNGCQLFSHLQELIPQAECWPQFAENLSERYEARMVNVKVSENYSPWLENMYGSLLPVPVAHHQGRAFFASAVAEKEFFAKQALALSYCDARGQRSESFPLNPNGSPQGLAGMLAAEGRVLAMMPHPERLWRRLQGSWQQQSWGENGPWLQLFINAYRYMNECLS